MTLEELDIFLHRYTEYEKDIISLNNSSFGTSVNAAPSEIPEPHFKKSGFALTRDEFINMMESYFSDPMSFTRLHDNMFIPQNENLTFLIHPRFFNKADCHVVSEHRHNFLELVYVYSGSCEQTVNGNKIRMTEGEFCILDTNVLHSMTVSSKQDILINCLMRKAYFDAAFIGRLAGNGLLTNFFTQAVYQNKKESNYILFHSGRVSEVREAFCKAMCEYFDRKMCSSAIVDSYMVILFSELLRVYKKDVYSRESETFHGTEISEIIAYIERNYKTATLESTACHFNFHPNYLSSVFKRLTGRRFIEFLQIEKLNSACSLLKSTNMPVEAVAMEVGYSNAHFFYQLFKKHYHTTPSQYRRNAYSGPEEHNGNAEHKSP